MAVGAIPASNSTIFGCYSTKSGDLRVVEKNERCGKKETRLSWNKEGATGATGARGPAGPAGPKGATGAQGYRASRVTPARPVPREPTEPTELTAPTE